MSTNRGTTGDAPHYRLFCATWSKFHPDTSLPALPQTGAGATAVAGSLRDLNMLADEPIHLDNPAGGACISAVEDFLGLPGECLIIYLASHGLVPAEANQFYRLATGDTRDVGDITRTLPLVEITRRLARSRATQKLLIVDACYSGKTSNLLLLPTHGSDDWATPEGICVLASSSPYQASSLESGTRLTSFTAALVDILSQGIPSLGPMLSILDLAKALEAQADTRQLPKPWMVAQGMSAERIVFRNRAIAGAFASDALRYSEATSEFDHRTEILYVDDEETYREDFSAELERAGHRVTLADTPRAASNALRTAHFDIIVFDLFLVGDLPACDAIHAAAAVAQDSMIFVVSRRSKGSEEVWARLDAIFPYPNPISAFLWKPEYVGEIVGHADLLRERRRSVLAHIENLEEAVSLVAGRMIRRDTDLVDHADRILLQVRICVERLVAKWFDPDEPQLGFIETMTLEPTGSGRSRCAVFTLTPAFRGIDPAAVMPLILKLGPDDEILEEVDRYDRYVQVGVPLDLRTDKVATARVGQVGGVIYSFRGSHDSDVYEVGQLSHEEIAACLDVVLNPTDGKKWFDSRASVDVNPIDHFKRLGYDVERFRVATREMATSIERLAPSTGAGAATNNGANGDEYKLGKLFEASVMTRKHVSTLVHGDLNLGNLVRSGEGRFAIIDYRTVGIGPRLVDFVTLEIACWHLAPAPAERDMRELFAQARFAVSATLRDERDADDVPEWLQSSWRLATKCRMLVRENFPDASAAEYGALLWLAAVRRSQLRPGGLSKQEARTSRLMPPALALAAQTMMESGPGAV